MRKTLVPLVFFLCCGIAAAQDCSFTFTFTGNATQAGQPNLSAINGTPCVNWRLTFSVTGTLSSTVTFQTSPDNASFTSVGNSICSSSQQPPCIISGANPITGTQGQMYVSAYGAYVRVVISSSSGSGTGSVRAYGAKGASPSASNNGGGSGPPGTNVSQTLGDLFGTVAGSSSTVETSLYGNAISPRIPLPVAGTIDHFYIRGGAGSDGTLVASIAINGVASAVSVTYLATTGGIRSDLTHSVVVAPGDVISILLVNNATDQSAEFNGLSFRFTAS